ncbi:MAG: NADPH:quinone oxidoreductase family protein [SAR324 cluster bacterium]|nr:NADPH:quinone oxidoreductase family protein [SAR324 cluster bacterium]
MKAWTLGEFGPHRKVLQWQKLPEPEPGTGQVRVRVGATGINFPDLLCIEGKYQEKPPLPFVPGMEAMGVVESVGPDCRLLNVGDRIIGSAKVGAFAEAMLFDEFSSYRIPDAMTDEDAGGFLVTHQTSYFALVHRAQLQPEEVLLVHGGAGGVGTTAIQLGKILGATVIATAGSEEKLEICRQCGADHVINYETTDFVEAVKEITNGRGADVIYDPVGGEILERSTKCIAWEGRLLVIGFAGGQIPKVAANRILLKNISVIGLFWGNYFKHNPGLVRETQNRLNALYERGRLKPVIYQVRPLSELLDALDVVAQRQVYGKLVLKP